LSSKTQKSDVIFALSRVLPRKFSVQGVIEPHAEVREGALQVPKQIFANFRTLLRAAGDHPHAPAPVLQSTI